MSKTDPNLVKLFAFLVPLFVISCTWVKPTEEGAHVTITDKSKIAGCKRISTITTSVKHTIGSMNRKADKVRTELITLARNEAAIRKGDTIVSRGPVSDGAMTFDVYQCD